MKNKWIMVAGVAAALIGFSATVQAVPVNGSIGFTGTYFQNGGTSGNLATATSMTILSTAITSTTGDLVGAGAPSSFATPIGVNVNLNNPVLVGATLWTVTVAGNLYTFTVTSETQPFTSGTQVNLQGTGTMIKGVDATTLAAGTWQLGFGVSGSSFTWQSTSATNLPDGGATVLLLGAALSGIGLLRKKLIV